MFSYEEINDEWSDYCLQNLLEFGLSWNAISSNPNITWKTIQQHFDKPWNYEYLGKNPNITWEIIKKSYNYPWCYYNLCLNPNIPLNNNYIKWNYNTLSKNPNITWEIVQANPDKPWCYSNLSRNPNITWEIVQANPDKPWDYNGLSSNPNITWEIVQANPHKDWSYHYLSYNPNITPKILQENRDKPWSYKVLSLDHLTITFEIIKKHLRCLNVYIISHNKFTLEKDMFFTKKLQEWFKKSDLKRELIANLWHPKNYEKFKYYIMIQKCFWRKKNKMNNDFLYIQTIYIIYSFSLSNK